MPMKRAILAGNIYKCLPSHGRQLASRLTDRSKEDKTGVHILLPGAARVS